MSLKVVQFLAVLLTALALVPGGAHLLALPNKIGLPQEPYFVVQQIYRGWSLLGIVLIAAVAADLYLAFLMRGLRTPFLLSLAGGLCVAATLIIFVVWTLPANEATDNWVSTPPNWHALRARWEYAHAASAVLTLIGFCLVVASTLTEGQARSGAD